MLFIILALVIFLHFLIGVYDFSFYRIPNLLLGLLIVLFAFFAPLYLVLQDILSSLLTFAIVLALSFALYGFKIIGAGDAKYISATSLWFGAHGVIPFLFVVSLIGGLLALAYLVFRDPIGSLSDWSWMKIQKIETRYPKFQKIWVASGAGPEKGKRENIGPRMVPYGVAIAAGAIIMLILNPITY